MFMEAVVHGPDERRQALSGNINAEAKMRCLRQVYFLSSRLPPAICNPPFWLGSISVGLEALLREHRTLSVSNSAIASLTSSFFLGVNFFEGWRLHQFPIATLVPRSARVRFAAVAHSC